MDYNNDNKKKNKRRGKGEGSIIKLPNGMRLGEIGGLSKSCINTDEGSIDVKS